MNHLLEQILCFFQEDKLVCHFDMWTYTTAFHFFEICNFLQSPFDHIQAGYKCDKFPNSYSTLYRLINDVTTSIKCRNIKTSKIYAFSKIRTRNVSPEADSFITPRRVWMHFTRDKPPYGFLGSKTEFCRVFSLSNGHFWKPKGYFVHLE